MMLAAAAVVWLSNGNEGKFNSFIVRFCCVASASVSKSHFGVEMCADGDGFYHVGAVFTVAKTKFSA